jgi:hypothetical protein
MLTRSPWQPGATSAFANSLEEDKVAAADQEHQQGEQQPVDGEAHQRARPDGLAVWASEFSQSGLAPRRVVAASPPCASLK